MIRISQADPRFGERLRRFLAQASTPPDIRESVERMLGMVRRQGDAAVLQLLKKFDGVALKAEQLSITTDEMKEGWDRLAPSERRALREARRCILSFHKNTRPRGWQSRNPHGAMIGERFYPLQRVGLYVPRGLVSTVLMTALPAQVAGVPELLVCTPPDREGKVSDGLLGAMHICGIAEAYRVGGVAAMGAMAYGTATIAPVVKIAGPGNAYVVEAKRQLFGKVGIDLLPGPSEVMILADSSADPLPIALDLLAQAEHGSGRERVILASPDPDLLDRVASLAQAERPRFRTGPAIAKVFRNSCLLVEVTDWPGAVELANQVAPEHLELEMEVALAKSILPSLTTAGAIMLGTDSATACGDYTAGPSHVLPTGGAGHFSSGLQVIDFMRRSSLVSYNPAALRKAAPVVAALASMEGMQAHGWSVRRRVDPSAEP